MNHSIRLQTKISTLRSLLSQYLDTANRRLDTPLALSIFNLEYNSLPLFHKISSLFSDIIQI